MKQLIILTGLVLILPFAILAQTTTVKFEYDAAGNRIKRWLEVKELKSSDSLIADPALYSLMADISDEATLGENSRETQVFPNPVERILTVAPGSGAANVCRYLLMDTQGRLLEDETVSTFPFNLNLQHRQAGTYYLHLQSGELNQLFKLIKN